MNDTTTGTTGTTVDRVHHAANAVVLAKDADGAVCVLLAQRDRAPHLGLWGLPGGVCLPGDAPAQVAVRRLREKTGVHLDAADLMHVSSRDEGRDDQGRYVTVSYVVLLPEPVPVLVGDAVRDVRWRRVVDAVAEQMPWDHAEILIESLRVAGLALDVG
ncbi:NUDIX domain-containing protein (plasmid) [Amycolatopsis sp. AA4]|uniref:NUDIX domain-containing protein n=1 Tax=Actinomycetes TaxID=1760 RepID=UPI0001B57162|nr:MULTISPECIES: NUDIX domain-containing protein [Actinomycetes]ATY17263.1 NUDIX domain-containing protein [Amycolatopsis sp. AA4]